MSDTRKYQHTLEKINYEEALKKLDFSSKGYRYVTVPCLMVTLAMVVVAVLRDSGNLSFMSMMLVFQLTNTWFHLYRINTYKALVRAYENKHTEIQY